MTAEVTGSVKTMKYLGLLGAVGAGPPHLPPRLVQAAAPEIRRVTWSKKPEVHWEPRFSNRPSR